MKKLLLFSLLSLFGCQVYELPNETPRLTGGKWVLSNYDIVVISSISDVKVIKNDTVCINAFNGQSYVSGNVLMKQFYNQTAKDRRFVIGKTTWEFDNNSNYLYCDFINKNGDYFNDKKINTYKSRTNDYFNLHKIQSEIIKSELIQIMKKYNYSMGANFL